MDKKLEEYFSTSTNHKPPFIQTSMIEQRIKEETERKGIKLLFLSAFLLMLITLAVCLLFPTPLTKLVFKFGWLLIVLPFALSLIMLILIYKYVKGSVSS